MTIAPSVPFSSVFDGTLPADLVAQTREATPADVDVVLRRGAHTPEDLAVLLSPAALSRLEDVAQAAQRLTRQRFGNVIVLYAPMYIGNECYNVCTYCGFSRDAKIARKTLTLDEVDDETTLLRERGFDHLLLVSGEDVRSIPTPMLCDAVRIAHRKFSSVAIEVGALTFDEYVEVVAAGADGLAFYQETYDPNVYRKVHLRGPKRVYPRRLDTPGIGAAAGFRSVGIGFLIGLADWRWEALAMAAHGRHLMKHHWQTRLAFSFPRLRPSASAFQSPHIIRDDEFVLLTCALRLAFPDADLTLSTRESPAMRENLARICFSRVSAGSNTAPGGYTADEQHTDHAGEQFQIDDDRPADVFAQRIAELGLEPVWKDWDRAFLASAHDAT